MWEKLPTFGGHAIDISCTKKLVKINKDYLEIDRSNLVYSTSRTHSRTFNTWSACQELGQNFDIRSDSWSGWGGDEGGRGKEGWKVYTYAFYMC